MIDAKTIARSLPSPINSQLGCYARSLAIATRFGLPEVIIRFGYGLGDDLLCTAVLHELRNRHRGESWMISNHPELFAGLNDANRVLPPDDVYGTFACILHGRQTVEA